MALKASWQPGTTTALRSIIAFLRTVVFFMNNYLKTPTTQKNVLPEDGEKGKLGEVKSPSPEGPGGIGKENARPGFLDHPGREEVPTDEVGGG